MDKTLKKLVRKRNDLEKTLNDINKQIFVIEVRINKNMRAWQCRELASICDMLASYTQDESMKNKFKKQGEIFRKLRRVKVNE